MIQKRHFLNLFFCFFILLASAAKAEPQVIVLDFGNTMATTDLTHVKDFISSSLELSDKETESLLKKWNRLSEKKKKGMEFWLNYAAVKGKNLPGDWKQNFKEVWCRATQPIPGMIELVEDLQKHGYQTALLSNTTPFRAEIIANLGYYELFCPVLLSYQIGASKPQKKAFEILLKVLNKPAHEILFIDDKQENVAAAKELGIDAIQFLNAEQLNEELLKRGITLSCSPGR